MKKWRRQRGVALLEAAITIPLLLLVSVAIFEFGRAFQTWQVITNAAREGARMAVMPGSDQNTIKGVVRTYLQDGNLGNYGTAAINISPATITVNGTAVSATKVTVDYPFQWIVLNPVARLISPGSSLGGGQSGLQTMEATATMRNETPAP